jgi:hypothetical protein
LPEPVSSPIDTRGGVRSTDGRAPISAPSLPKLSAEAAQLLAGLSTASPEDQWPAFEELMRTIFAKPSRAGAEVLEYSAAIFRNAGLDDLAGRMTLVKAVISAQCDGTEALESGLAKMNETAQAAIKEAYALGFGAGQAELKKQLPAVVRETTFISDDKGRVVGKTEREFKAGGNK